MENGELDGYAARHVLVIIGTNNLASNTDEEILAGLTHLVSRIREHQPAATIVLSGLLPRRKMEARIARLNRAIAGIAGVSYSDPGKTLLDSEGHIDESPFSDGLHPNAAGYRVLVKPALT